MRRITFSVCMSVAASGALVAVSPVAAQGGCVRIIDLGDIGAEPSSLVGLPGSTEPFAINNSQQVVFNVDTGSAGACCPITSR